MDEPELKPLTDNPKIKEPKKIRLYPKPITNDLWINENNNENNSESIQELETYETD